jgi:phosphatidylglycerol:prolipoprotein diacylglycerol transferase
MHALLAAIALPFLKPPPPIDIGVPIQVFGMIVAAGVLIGAAILRRYAEWHGVSDEHIRGLTGWIMVAGFLGAHWFDVLAYQWNEVSAPAGIWPPSHWPVVIRFWDGISSYGGFIGGAVGFAIYVFWKRLPVRLYADIAVIGLLPAFSIGRIGCSVVSDHIGAAVDPAKWYAFIAMDYPRSLNMAHLAEHYPGTSEFIRAWNLGLIEFLYLIPVNALILYFAFRTKKRLHAGVLSALAGLLYSPVRFFLDFLRPEETDPRHFGLTFAQWASILAFGVAAYVIASFTRNGAPAETVAPTSGEAQRRLKMVLKEQAEAGAKKQAAEPPPKTREEQDKDEGDETSGDEGVDDPAKPVEAPKVESDSPGTEPMDPNPTAAPAPGPKKAGGGGNKNKKKR